MGVKSILFIGIMQGVYNGAGYLEDLRILNLRILPTTLSCYSSYDSA